MSSAWQEDIGPSGAIWFVREDEAIIEVVAPPGVGLEATDRGDAPGWRHGIWDLTVDRFIVPFEDPPDKTTPLTTTEVLRMLPQDHYATLQSILENQLAIARQFGVATQQRLWSGGTDPGSISEHWLTGELRTAFGVDADAATLVSGRMSDVRTGFEQSEERPSVRVELRRLLRVTRIRVPEVYEALPEGLRLAVSRIWRTWPAMKTEPCESPAATPPAQPARPETSSTEEFAAVG